MDSLITATMQYKSPCVFREKTVSPIFQGIYNFETGTIECGNDILTTTIKFDETYYKSLSYGEQVVPKFLLSEYMYYLEYFNALLVVPFYDTGVIIVTSTNSFVYYFEHNVINTSSYKYHNIDTLFGRKLHKVGIYKTIVNSYDIVSTVPYLYVDEDGYFLTSKGYIKTSLGEVNPNDNDLNITSLICGLFAKGYDGIIVDKGDKIRPFIIENCRMELY